MTDLNACLSIEKYLNGKDQKVRLIFLTRENHNFYCLYKCENQVRSDTEKRQLKRYSFLNIAQYQVFYYVIA